MAKRRPELLIVALALFGCTDDRDAINASDHVFELVEVHYDNPQDEFDGGIELVFEDLDGNRRHMSWEGSVGQGVNHLERLDVNSCYRRPLRDPEEVSCAEHR